MKKILLIGFIVLSFRLSAQCTDTIKQIVVKDMVFLYEHKYSSVVVSNVNNEPYDKKDICFSVSLKENDESAYLTDIAALFSFERLKVLDDQRVTVLVWVNRMGVVNEITYLFGGSSIPITPEELYKLEQTIKNKVRFPYLLKEGNNSCEEARIRFSIVFRKLLELK